MCCNSHSSVTKHVQPQHLGPLKLDSVQRALEETLLLHAASFTNVLIFCMALC